MKLRYKNYEIEQDQYCWILRIYWIIKTEWSENIWEEYVIQSTFPHSLSNALRKIRELEIKNKDFKSFETLAEEIKELDEKFLQDINSLLKPLWLKNWI
jgi:hypothetical protein